MEYMDYTTDETAMTDAMKSASRLRHALRMNYPMKPSELAEKTNLSRGAISHYTSGRHTPTNITAAKLAEALNVNPVWLMGFDVPMLLDDELKKTAVHREPVTFVDELKKLAREDELNFYDTLNVDDLKEEDEKILQLYHELPRSLQLDLYAWMKWNVQRFTK